MIVSLLLASLETPPPTLAVESLIVGHYASKRWTQAGYDVPTWTNVPFRQVFIGKLGKTVKISKCVKMEMTGTVHLMGALPNSAYGALWSGPQPKFPRPVKVAKSLLTKERKAVQGFLALKDLGKTKFNIRTIVRGDFDGDGRADSVMELMSAAEDYSLVLLAQGGKSPTALWWETKDAEGQLAKGVILGMADLDSDGVLDLILSGQYIEGGSGTLWSLKKTGPVKLVSHDA